MNMATFIAKMIIKAGKKSEEQGKAKYRAYFVSTDMYSEWKEEVDVILTTDGYEDLIVAE